MHYSLMGKMRISIIDSDLLYRGQGQIQGGGGHQKLEKIRFFGIKV
jgi:hypothetical protein